MLFETLIVLAAILLGAIAFCLSLVVLAKVWYYFWYSLTFVLILIKEKGHYSLEEHSLLTKHVL